jgi:hypothetical protein
MAEHFIPHIEANFTENTDSEEVVDAKLNPVW